MTMYFIALVLPSALNERILHWKNLMLQNYGCKVGLKSPAHITLVPPFWMEEEKELALIKDVEGIASQLHPFPIRTKNFSAFKPRTLFIDVELSKELVHVKNTVDSFFKQNEFYSIKVDTRPFHPHITIATRDLFKKAFFEAWPLFEKEKFEEEWTAFDLSILRHNKKNWDVLQTSQFQIINKTS